MTEIKVKLVRSRIGTTPAQRRMLDSLGLKPTDKKAAAKKSDSGKKRFNLVKTFKDTPAIRGIIAKVSHLVAVVD